MIMTYPVTAPFAAVLMLILFVLSQLVIRARSRTAIALGDGNDPRLLEASRRQMNFVENVPMALILMALAEAGGAGGLWLHIAGGVLVLARLVHPFGITVANPAHPLRIAGTLATTAVQLGLSVILLMQYLS
jgi:uncharacterized protein